MTEQTEDQNLGQDEAAAVPIAQVNVESEQAETIDAAPTDQDQPVEDPALVLNVTSLDGARALPELTGDATIEDALYAPGSIERFMDADERTMQIVSVGGKLRKVALAIDEVPTEA